MLGFELLTEADGGSFALSDVGTDDYDTSEKQRIPAWTGWSR